MSPTSSRPVRRMSTPLMITLGIIGVLVIALTVLTVVRDAARDEDSTTVQSVLTGQSMEVVRNNQQQVVRFETVRAPLPKGEEDQEESFDTCLAKDARDYLASLAPEGTEIDMTMPGYSSAPNGEFWATIKVKNKDLALEMVKAGYAAPSIEDAKDSDQAQELRDAQKQAYEDKRGIYSKDADCTLPSTIDPLLEKLSNLPEAKTGDDDFAELSTFIAELNSLRTEGQQVRGMISAIPTSGDSVTALAWGPYKNVYMDQVDEKLDKLTNRLEAAQEHRENVAEDQVAEEIEDDGALVEGLEGQEQDQGETEQQSQQDSQQEQQQQESQEEQAPQQQAPQQQASAPQPTQQQQQQRQHQPGSGSQNKPPANNPAPSESSTKKFTFREEGPRVTDRHSSED